jgi:hypothetical protein
MRITYVILRKLKLIYELFMKMPFVPLRDIVWNIVRQEKIRQILDKVLERELEGRHENFVPSC